MTHGWEQFDEYQTRLDGYDIGSKEPADYVLVQFLGLIGELGEVCEKIKKSKRDGTPLDVADLTLECGDMAYYQTRLHRILGISYSDVIKANLAKLEDRRVRNVLSGRGDRR